jgi:hypothetical protein
MEIYTIGIDLGKSAVSFGRCRFGGTVVVRIRCFRAQLLAYTANMQVRRIGRRPVDRIS